MSNFGPGPVVPPFNPPHLGPGPEIPPISEFFQTSLEAIVKAQSKEKFDTAFDRLFANNAKFTLNGHSVARESYERTLLKQSVVNEGTVSATLSIEKSVEGDNVNLKIHNVPHPGLAGVIYQVAVHKQNSEKTVIESSVNIVVENNNSFNRKIIEINQIVN